MPKIINKPAECGYRILPDLNQCSHWSPGIKQCPDPLNFPTACPLVDGIVADKKFKLEDFAKK